MSDILDIAQLAVQSAINAGAEWADASVGTGRIVGVMVDNSSITECEVVRDYAVGVRAFVKGGMGSATATAIDEATARKVGEQAAAMAKATHGDPEFVALPDPQAWEEVPGRWDDSVAGLTPDTVVQWCQAGIEEARSVASEASVSGGASMSYGEKAIASSTGVALCSRGTNVEISFFSVVQRGDDVGAYFEFDAGRRLCDFDPVGIGTVATEKAVQYIGARHVESGPMSLVLGPMAVSALVGSTIGAANAESVQRNRTFMVGKQGERIGAECLTVREEPLVPAGLMSAGADGEGQPKVARALIDKGILTTYLHNSYTANKAKVVNTAHARRGGGSAGVGIGTSNLQFDLGDKTEAELIAEIDDGLYIASGGLQPDGATGDISATVDFGFKIEKGELAYPVATTMIGSNVMVMLGSIDAVSSDYREEPGMITPSVRITDVMVVGGG